MIGMSGDLTISANGGFTLLLRNWVANNKLLTYVLSGNWL
jgi:hypothetical protein